MCRGLKIAGYLGKPVLDMETLVPFREERY